MKIDPNSYTREQIASAIACAHALSLAYALAAPENGGDGKVRWDSVNAAWHCCLGALSAGWRDEIAQEAKAVNGEVAR